jgi:hypothetical protein
MIKPWPWATIVLASMIAGALYAVARANGWGVVAAIALIFFAPGLSMLWDREPGAKRNMAIRTLAGIVWSVVGMVGGYILSCAVGTICT